MSVGKYEITRCDSCGGEDDLHTLLVSYRVEGAQGWQVDLCPSCYQGMFGALMKKSVPARKTTLKPQRRMTETIITEKNL